MAEPAPTCSASREPPSGHAHLSPASDSSQSSSSDQGTANIDMSRLKLGGSPPTSGSAHGHDVDGYNEETSRECESGSCQCSSDDDDDDEEAEDGECPFGNPFLKDSFGNLTKWRLSDLGAAFTKHLANEAKNPKPKEKKLTKEERLKIHSDRMEGYMKSALLRYNSEEGLAGDMVFEFEKAQHQNWIVEGEFDNHWYYHFNIAAKQAGSSSVSTFFAEVTPDDGDDCDVICCKFLNDDDNGHCFGCKNQGVDDLKHPACERAYAGGHEDRSFPFMENSETEDDDND